MLTRESDRCADAGGEGSLGPQLGPPIARGCLILNKPALRSGGLKVILSFSSVLFKRLLKIIITWLSGDYLCLISVKTQECENSLLYFNYLTL